MRSQNRTGLFLVSALLLMLPEAGFAQQPGVFPVLQRAQQMANQQAGQQAGQQQGQQTPAQPPKLMGTITEIKEVGRNTVAVITNDQGQTVEALLNRTAIEIIADGDEGFVREGAYIGAEGVFTNEVIIVDSLRVQLPQQKNQKFPRGMIRKAPPRPGTSQNSYQLIGSVQALKPNPDYPEYTMLLLDAPGRNPIINLRQGYTVKVLTGNPELLQAGMEVEIEGQANRGKFVVTKLIVNLPEPLDSAEIYGTSEKPADSE